ncbi:hypothetical protein C5C74_16440, partial [Rathayibacter sp. AY1E8]
MPAIVVTVAIAQRTEFRSEPLSLAAALLAVASSWVLMVFSFARTRRQPSLERISAETVAAIVDSR